MGYLLREKFNCFNEDHIPYGLDCEVSSFFAHKHVRVTDDKKFYISAGGNKYLFKCPDFMNTKLEIDFHFHYIAGKDLGIEYFFRYDGVRRRGLVLSAVFAKPNIISFNLEYIDGIKRTALGSESLSGVPYPAEFEQQSLHISVEGERLTARINDKTVRIDIPAELCIAGRSGIGIINMPGETGFTAAALSSDDKIEGYDIYFVESTNFASHFDTSLAVLEYISSS